MEAYQPKKNLMETLLLKMMISWAIMIIGFVALFAGCNSPRPENSNVYQSDDSDSVSVTPPDNTRTDGVKQKSTSDTSAVK
jgi:hypothetical protein